MRHMRAGFAGLLAVTVLATGCSGATEQPPPPVEPAAEALAEALTTGDFTRVEVAGSADPTGELATILEGMHGLHPQVEIGDVDSYPESATVDLTTTWNLSSPWTYTTTADFTLEGDTWQAHWDPALVNPDLTAETRLERETADSDRGAIVGTNGYQLTQSGPATLVGIDTTQPGIPAADSAKRLAELVSVNSEAYVQEVNERQGEFVAATALPAAAVPEELAEIPGAVEREASLPTANPDSSAAAITGHLGTASADEAATSSGTVAPGGVIGRSGVQKTRDDVLRGTGATKVYLVPRTQAVGQLDPENNQLLADYPSAPGADVNINVDGAIQDAIDTALAGQDDPTSVVAIRPTSGELVAAGDSSGAARANHDSLNEPFAPEAAAAPIAALALMRSGAQMSDEVKCENELDVEGRIITESDLSQASTETTLEQAIANGCSTALASQHGRVDAAKITNAAASLGIGVDHDIAVPADFGSAQPGATGGDLAEAMAGQGAVQVTPLGLASMAASIKSGYIIVPWLMADAKPLPDGQPPLAGNETEMLQDLMESGASASGSGISGADGALLGYHDNRLWAVGYSDDVAFAVVTYTESPSRSEVTQVASQVTRAAAQGDSSSDSSSGEN